MSPEQDLMFDELISNVYTDRASSQPSFTDYSNHEGQSWDSETLNDKMVFRPFNNTYSIAKDGLTIVSNMGGEIFTPANCRGEYYFVLPAKNNSKFIKSAAVAVFEAFTDDRYLEHAKEVGYSLVYKDGDKMNPDYNNIHIKFNED
jgi:hypothetical protein